MKTLGTLLIIGGIVFTGLWIFNGIKANYEWVNNYESYWALADKASTIAQKSDYIDKFVSALEASGLQGVNDALIFPTPNTDFDSNLIALKSLQSRLATIKTMDEKSFQYQSVIQQITAQEQGDAKYIMGVLSGCWWKVHHYILWNLFFNLLFIVIIIGLIVGGVVILSMSSNNY